MSNQYPEHDIAYALKHPADAARRDQRRKIDQEKSRRTRARTKGRLEAERSAQCPPS